MGSLVVSAWSVVLLQGAPAVVPANPVIGPRLPSVQRSISTHETLTIELFQWETSANGGPVHYEQYKALVGQRWRRSFELDLTDVDQDLRAPGRRTRRVFGSALDSLTRVYGQPSTGPDTLLWSFRGWLEHLALDLVTPRDDALPQYLDEESQPTAGLSQSKLDSLRGDCTLAGLSRRIAEQGAGSAVVRVEPELLRDVLFPGGELFEIEFALSDDLAGTDPEIWYEPWPCWEYVGRSAQFERCSGTIELTPKSPEAPRDGNPAAHDPHAPTTFAVAIRVACRTDASALAQSQKMRYRNDLRLVEYHGRIDTTFGLDGELVYDGASSVVRSLRLSGAVTVADSVDVLRGSDQVFGVSKCHGTFRASGTLEHRWVIQPGG